jgi:hypothetical protein
MVGAQAPFGLHSCGQSRAGFFRKGIDQVKTGQCSGHVRTRTKQPINLLLYDEQKTLRRHPQASALSLWIGVRSVFHESTALGRSRSAPLDAKSRGIITMCHEILCRGAYFEVASSFHRARRTSFTSEGLQAETGHYLGMMQGVQGASGFGYHGRLSGLTSPSADRGQTRRTGSCARSLCGEVLQVGKRRSKMLRMVQHSR